MSFPDRLVEMRKSRSLTQQNYADTTKWAPLEQGFIKQLQTASPAAFDASDQMPAEVGSGTFWTEGTSL